MRFEFWKRSDRKLRWTTVNITVKDTLWLLLPSKKWFSLMMGGTVTWIPVKIQIDDDIDAIEANSLI